MDPDLLVTSLIEQGREAAKLVNERVPVSMAYWLKPDEEQGWLLCLAGPDLGSEGKWTDAFHAVAAATRTPLLRGFNPLRLRFLREDDPIATEAREMRDKYPELMPYRYRGARLGNQTIEEAYLYEPLPVPAAHE